MLVDVFYDHLLAKDWAEIHHQPLGEYCGTVYVMIRARLHDLPNSSHPGLHMMAQQDWLTSYAQIEEIIDVLARMSRRARQPNPLANGEHEFFADVDGFTGDFYEWLANAKVFCLQWQEQVITNR